MANQTNGNTSGVLLRVPQKSRWARLPFGVRMSVGAAAVLAPLVGAGLVTVALVQGSQVTAVLGSSAPTPASTSPQGGEPGAPGAVTGLGGQSQGGTPSAGPSAGNVVGRVAPGPDGARPGTAGRPDDVTAAPGGRPMPVAPRPPRPRPTGPGATPPRPGAGPVVGRHWVSETRTVPYRTRMVRDPGLPRGAMRVRTPGEPGTETLRYEVTTVDGRQTGRRLVSRTVTRQPVTRVVAVGTRREPGRDCNLNYDGCVPVASDVDCRDGEGGHQGRREHRDGPAYVARPVRVVRHDVYELDRDGDGHGCDPDTGDDGRDTWHGRQGRGDVRDRHRRAGPVRAPRRCATMPGWH